MTVNRPAETRLIRPKEAAKILGVTVPTLYRWINEDDDFPQRYRMGPNTVGFDSDELYDYYEDRIQPVVDKPEKINV